jgi:hypothetical protein
MTKVIHNGDHLQYEIDNERMDPKERSDWPMPSFDAMDWAEAFHKQYPNIPVDNLLPWFAGALMRGYDEKAQRLKVRDMA